MSQFTQGACKFIDTPTAQALTREVFEEDCYNFARIPESSIVIDIGACHGEFAIRSAVEKHCYVIAYEPSRENRAVLEQNAALNNLADFAIASEAIGSPGQRRFVHRPDHPAGSLFEEEAVKHGCTGNSYLVDVVDLGSQIKLAKERWGAKLPICVKMDCEGAEHEIFADVAWLQDVKIVAMEWHNFDGAFFREILESHGFKTLVEGGGPKPRPILETTGQWSWKNQPWGPIGAGLLFAERT